MLENLIGASIGPRKIEYNWRDMVLYALAVGAGPDDLLYTYEKNLKALPTFGVLPYFSAVNVSPQRPGPYAAPYLAHDLMVRELGYDFPLGLHMGHELIQYRPLDPIKGSLIYTDTITHVYDRGRDKGIVIESEEPVYDEAGRLLCLNRSRSLLPVCGGFGGPSLPRRKISFPDREPDHTGTSTLSDVQNVLYRLTGDTAPGHIDPEVSRLYSDRGPIMQGLCSFGYACRMLIAAVIPGRPEQFRRMEAEMRAVCYPGDTVTLQAWDCEGKVVFKLLNAAAGKAILDNGEFEYTR